MEKQEAIDFILEEIGKNRSEDEIVEELSSLLGAPQDMVRRFVSRTLASSLPLEPVPPVVEAPEEMAETQSPSSEESVLEQDADLSEQTAAPQDYQELAQTSDSSFTEVQYAQEIQPVEDAQLVEEIQQAEEYQFVESAQPDEEVLQAEEYQLVEDVQQVEGVQQVEDLQPVYDDHVDETIPPPAPVWDPDALAKKTAEPLSPGDQVRLEKAILAALSKERKQTDVVMMVCERTGMSWDQAQRLVAEVSMKNRKKSNRRQGLVQILLSLLAVLAGLALIFLVLSELYTFYRLYAQPEAMGTATYAVLDRYTIWAGVLGTILFLGGITGMVLGIRKRLD